MSNVKLSDFINEIYNILNYIAPFVNVFGDWCDSFTFKVNYSFIVDINTTEGLFVYKRYNYVYFFHIPYLTLEAGILLTFMLRYYGYKVVSEYEIKPSDGYDLPREIVVIST